MLFYCLFLLLVFAQTYKRKKAKPLIVLSERHSKTKIRIGIIKWVANCKQNFVHVSK